MLRNIVLALLVIVVVAATMLILLAGDFFGKMETCRGLYYDADALILCPFIGGADAFQEVLGRTNFLVLIFVWSSPCC